MLCTTVHLKYTLRTWITDQKFLFKLRLKPISIPIVALPRSVNSQIHLDKFQLVKVAQVGSTWRRSDTSLTDRISTLAKASHNVLICVNTASPVATGRETSRQLADKRLTAWQLPYLIFFNICSVCSLSFLNKGAKTDKLQNFQAGLLLQSLQWRSVALPGNRNSCG